MKWSSFTFTRKVSQSHDVLSVYFDSKLEQHNAFLFLIKVKFIHLPTHIIEMLLQTPTKMPKSGYLALYGEWPLPLYLLCCCKKSYRCSCYCIFWSWDYIHQFHQFIPLFNFCFGYRTYIELWSLWHCTSTAIVGSLQLASVGGKCLLDQLVWCHLLAYYFS